MKSIFKVVLALAFFVCSIPANAQTPSATKTTTAPKTTATKATKKFARGYGCRSNYHKMLGTIC